MRNLTVSLLILLLAVTSVCAAPSETLNMHPYTGIGVLLVQTSDGDNNEPVILYEDPGYSRLGILNLSTVPKYDWMSAAPHLVIPLIVTGRKGSWLRVVYDDGGREAWMSQTRSSVFESWDDFLKDNVCITLPGLKKKYYRLYLHPEETLLSVMSSGQFLKVLKLENDWVKVLTDRNLQGWVRWRDEDGRLLIGVSSIPHVMHP